MDNEAVVKEVKFVGSLVCLSLAMNDNIPVVAQVLFVLSSIFGQIGYWLWYCNRGEK